VIASLAGQVERVKPGEVVVNVGSVGQPRDYDNRACFVVYDTEARAVEYVRVTYDIEAAAKKHPRSD
jgi:diadenosine tetraphosphatase ApaH/serine/threonine PP2A family protein phosphatase